MEQVKKNWLGWMISALIAFLTVILTSGLGNASRNEYEQNLKIDSKVDRSEYVKHCDSNEKNFESINNTQKVYMDRQNELLQKIVEQQAKMSTDLEWIKTKIK